MSLVLLKTITGLLIGLLLSSHSSLECLAPSSQAKHITLSQKLGRQVCSTPAKGYPKAQHKASNSSLNQIQPWWIILFKPFKLDTFFSPAFPTLMMEQFASLGSDWRKFVQDQKKLMWKARVINFFMGAFSFVTIFFLMLFIITEGLTLLVAVIWLGGLFGLVIVKVFFEKLNQKLFEDFSFRFQQLLLKEKIAYEQSRMANPNVLNALRNAEIWRLPFWESAQMRVVDTVVSFLAVVIAISISNPLFLIIFIPLFLIMLRLLGEWGENKNNSKEAYMNARFSLENANRLNQYLGLSENTKDITPQIIREHQKYLNTKSKFEYFLRLMILFLLPLVGVILVFAFGFTSAPLLLYIVSINFYGIFQLLDFITVAHNGMITRNHIESFSHEVSHHPLIINQSSWPDPVYKQRLKYQHSFDKNRVKSLELNLKYFYEKFRKTKSSVHNKTLHLQNIHITSRRKQVIAFIGKSGSGKTTLLQLMASLLSLNSLKIKVGPHTYKSRGRLTLHYKDKDSFALTPASIRYQDLRKLIRYVSLDNFQYFKTLPPLSPRIKKRYSCYKKKLIPAGDPEEGTASSGELVRIQLALILATNTSPFLMLDQPLQSLDEDSQVLVLKTLKQYAKKKNVSIVIASPELLQHSKKLKWLDHTVSLDKIKRST